MYIVLLTCFLLVAGGHFLTCKKKKEKPSPSPENSQPNSHQEPMKMDSKEDNSKVDVEEAKKAETNKTAESGEKKPERKEDTAREPDFSKNVSLQRTQPDSLKSNTLRKTIKKGGEKTEPTPDEGYENVEDLNVEDLAKIALAFKPTAEHK